MATIQLNSGYKMPLIGLGTWLSNPGEVETAVVAAIDCGYRLIDCAYGYGNEKEVGKGLHQALSSGKVKREELFVVSKLWNSRHSPSDVVPSLRESLADLGLDYLDLFLIHWPISFKSGAALFPRDDQGNLIYGNTHYLDTWKAMEEATKLGLVRSIGISNFNHKQIQDLIDNGSIKPAVLQIEASPYFQQEKLINFCQERGLAVMAFSSLGSPGRPWADKTEAPLLEDPILVSIAKKHEKSTAQVVLRWLFQRNVIAIPKSVTPSRIQENFKIFDFSLTADEMKAIKSLDKNYRVLIPLVERNGVMEVRDTEAPFFPWLDPEVF